MKKRMLPLALCALLLALCLSGCCMSHDYAPATCDAPATCTKCGKTEGEALTHEFSAPTCTEPAVCGLCGAEGEPALGHEESVVPAVEPTAASTGLSEGSVCKRCGEVLAEQQTLKALLDPSYLDLKVGDTCSFGSYEQDNELTNGAEPIEWVVFAVEDGRILLASRTTLMAGPYAYAQEPSSWGTSAMRDWMNGEFLNTAFNDAELSRILEVETPTNGSTTTDRVFAVSRDELLELLPSATAVTLTYTDLDSEAYEYKVTGPEADRMNLTASAYAEANGAYITKSGTYWWLRDTASCRDTDHNFVELPERAMNVRAGENSIGYFREIGLKVFDDNSDGGYRPFLWLDLTD